MTKNNINFPCFVPLSASIQRSSVFSQLSFAILSNMPKIIFQESCSFFTTTLYNFIQTWVSFICDNNFLLENLQATLPKSTQSIENNILHIFHKQYHTECVKLKMLQFSDILHPQHWWSECLMCWNVILKQPCYFDYCLKWRLSHKSKEILPF